MGRSPRGGAASRPVGGTGRRKAAILSAALVGVAALSGAACGGDSGSTGVGGQSSIVTPTVDDRVMCALAGCDSGVVVDLADLPAGVGYKAAVCVDSLCKSPEFVAGAGIGETFPNLWESGPKPTLSDGASSRRLATVRVTVTDGVGAVVFDATITARRTESSPNGPDCPPTCWYVTVGYDATTGRLVDRSS